MIDNDKSLTPVVEVVNDLPEVIEFDSLDEDEQYLTEENQDELTPPEIVPTFADFKANNFGAPTKYREDMPQRLFEFYHKPRMRIVKEQSTSYGKPIIKTYEVPERFPTVEYFCSLQSITRETFYQWLKEHADLSDTYKSCKLWAKDTLVQNALEGKWNYKVVVLVAQNYTEMREVPDDSLPVEDDGSGGVEAIPPKKKGYDISSIDKYRSKAAIETTAVKVKDGEEKSVQVSQETKDL